MRWFKKGITACIILFAFVFVFGTTVVADEPADPVTITYVLAEEESLRDALEAEGLLPPSAKTGQPGTQVHHIPVLSSKVYTFLGWYARDGEGNPVQHRKYDVIDADITLYGKWRLTPRVVAYDLDGGINDPANPRIVYANQTYELEPASRFGFDFTGWLLDETPVSTLESVFTSVLLTATWSPKLLTVTIDYDTDGVDDDTLAVTFGEAYVLPVPVPEKVGFDFDGWLDSDGMPFAASGTVDFDSDVTVTAQWTPRTDTEYTVKTFTQNIDDDDYTLLSTAVLTAETLSLVILEPEVPEGFTLNAALSELEGVVAADGSLELEIYFDRAVYTVTFLDLSDDVLKVEDVRFGGTATPPVYTVPGFTVSWDTAAFTEVDDDVVTQVILTANDYTITFVVDGQTFDPVAVTFGQAIPALPVPDAPANQIFNAWRDALEPLGSIYTAGMTYDVPGDLTLFAEFIFEDDIEYVIEYRFENEAGEFVLDPARTLTLTGTAGDTVTAPALDPVPVGFVLFGTLPQGTIVSPDGTLVLTVDYARIVYTVTFEFFEEDEATTLAVEVKHGLDVTAPVLDARTGYTFTGWSAPLEAIVATQTITAEYDAIDYPIHYALNDDSFDDPAILDDPVSSYTIEDETITLPVPERTYFTFLGWFDNAELEGDPVTTIPAGSTGAVTVYASWAPVTYDVTFDEGETQTVVTVEVSGTVAPEDFPEVTAPEGTVFLYWTYTEAGTQYEFTVDTIIHRDYTVTPQFMDIPTVTAVNDLFDVEAPMPLVYTIGAGGSVVSITGHGIEATDYNFEDGTLTISVDYLQYFYEPGTYNLTLTLDLDGLVETDVVITFEVVWATSSYQIINASFETGDLYGWNSYDIWKNETGMRAFVDARVVSGTYFNDYTYNRDGDANLGIVWDGAAWPQGSERMGHLRSSDFELGGSGWISFRLGGGRQPSLSYVSIRNSETHEEVARFANRHFNNTGIASDQFGSAISNAEAFMFQYYYDLAAIDGVELGDSFYIVISETASFHWNILSADAFFTYYEVAPEITADLLAENIVPSILGTETATNQIVNGSFDTTDLEGWDNVDGVFQRWADDADAIISNVGGDGSLGLIRSSAFSLDGDNQYMRWDWAGRLLADKEIYISIREVGTNIEVMRIVRRPNLSGFFGGDRHNHVIDLSDLPTDRLYYLEIVDNAASGDWAVNIVKNIRLITESEYNGVPEGDRAEVISGLVTDFDYIAPVHP
ncbi:MAG: hypothetical protein EA374_03650 [Acholeplasmatales bacterium]|nr:MAG: hypothetical protein EA374_03650 [Acholeplasmatales bacterium]